LTIFRLLRKKRKKKRKQVILSVCPWEESYQSRGGKNRSFVYFQKKEGVREGEECCGLRARSAEINRVAKRFKGKTCRAGQGKVLGGLYTKKGGGKNSTDGRERLGSDHRGAHGMLSIRRREDYAAGLYEEKRTDIERVRTARRSRHGGRFKKEILTKTTK